MAAARSASAIAHLVFTCELPRSNAGRAGIAKQDTKKQDTSGNGPQGQWVRRDDRRWRFPRYIMGLTSWK
jgi:hypothetical protein